LILVEDSNFFGKWSSAWKKKIKLMDFQKKNPASWTSSSDSGQLDQIYVIKS
jgi:hypothetical protein